jgi:transcription elongation factor S-II
VGLRAERGRETCFAWNGVDASQEMASESVRAMKEKIASDNLFKAKAVGETQVRAAVRR